MAKAKAKHPKEPKKLAKGKHPKESKRDRLPQKDKKEEDEWSNIEIKISNSSNSPKESASIDKKRGRSGFNWRATLVDFAAISGVLAGFCVTFIALILSGSIADIKIFGSGITFGHVSVLIFGISTALFISAAELFLRAKEFNIYGISRQRRDFLERSYSNWEDVLDDHDEKCQKFETYGCNCYNCSIFLIFIGLFFVIFPYNWVFATIVSSLGIFLELIQIVKKI